MANPIGGQDNIEYNIMLQATQAIQDLKALTMTATSLDEKMKMVSASVQEFGQKAGLAPQQALAMFKQVEQEAVRVQAMLKELAGTKGGIPPMVMQNPMVAALSNTPQIFNEAAGPMWGQVGVQLKEDQAALDAMNKSGEQVAKTFEKDAAAASGIAVNVRTAAENTKALYEFAQGSKGQGILTQMFGDLKGASSAAQSVNIIKSSMTQLRTETGATVPQVAQLMEQLGVPKFQVTQATKELNEELSGIPANAGRAVRSIDAIRIALGAIVAMIVFNAIQAIQNFFREAIQGARDFEGALYNIRNAERIMSQEGIDIAPKDMQEMITGLQKLIPMINQLDATKAVASIALFTKDLGYTKKEIGDLTNAIGVLYLRNKSLGLSFEQVRSQVLTGLLTGRAQGIRDLGVSISESAIQAEALRMGLVKTSEDFKKLTGDAETQIKAQAMLSIVLRNTSQELDAVGEYAQTTDGRLAALSATWSNITTNFGRAVSPLLGIFATIINAGLKAMITLEMVTAASQAKIAAVILTTRDLLSGSLTSISQISDAFQKNYDTMLNATLKLHGFTTDLSTMGDTATDTSGKLDGLAGSLVDMSKVNLDSLINSLVNLGQRLDDLNAKFATDRDRAQEDYIKKAQRLDEDYENDKAKTIQDYNDRMADAEAKYRLEQLMAEKRYQEDLRKLRAQYLFDLEDALRARDARQVLRLQEQYRMDKTNLTNQFKLESEERARQHQLEMAQLRREEAEKLAELEREHQLKEKRMEEDFKLEQQRRQEDYERQKAEIAREIEQRLQQEADAIGDEYNLNETQKKELYNLLNKYYGPNGLFDGLYNYSYDSLVAKTTAMLSVMAGMIGAMQSMTTMTGMGSFTFPESIFNGESGKQGIEGGGGGGSGGGAKAKSGAYAGGGMALATSPTTATFGEAGPELAMFLPLSKPLTSPRFSGFSPASGGSSKMNGRVIIEPSPDLVAKVVDSTLDEAGKQIVQVYRSRR